MTSVKTPNYLTIKRTELKQLVFWAHAGTGYAQGGSYSQTIPKIIVKEMKRLKLNPVNFCCFRNPLDKKRLSNRVLEEYIRRTDTS